MASPLARCFIHCTCTRWRGGIHIEHCIGANSSFYDGDGSPGAIHFAKLCPGVYSARPRRFSLWSVHRLFPARQQPSLAGFYHIVKRDERELFRVSFIYSPNIKAGGRRGAADHSLPTYPALTQSNFARSAHWLVDLELSTNPV